MGDSFKLSGEKELLKILKLLPGRVQRKVLRAAVSAGATPIVNEVKRDAESSRESGALQASIDKKIKTYSRTNTVVAVVGPRTDVRGIWQGELRVPWRYAHLVEDGHIDANGNFVPGKPFLRPGYDAKEGEALAIIEDRIASGVLKEAANV